MAHLPTASRSGRTAPVPGRMKGSVSSDRITKLEGEPSAGVPRAGAGGPPTAGGAAAGGRVVSEHVDYLSYKFDELDLHSTWKVATKKKDSVVNGRRLENASWRKFFQTRFNLATISPTKLNWEKHADIVWLYGPFHTYEPLPVLEARYLDAGGLGRTPTGATSDGRKGPKSSLKKRRNSRQEFIHSIRKQQQQQLLQDGEGMKRVGSDGRLASSHRVAFSMSDDVMWAGGEPSLSEESASPTSPTVITPTTITAAPSTGTGRPRRQTSRSNLAGAVRLALQSDHTKNRRPSAASGGRAAEEEASESDSSTSVSSLSSSTRRSVGTLLKFQAHEQSLARARSASGSGTPVFVVGGGVDSPTPSDPQVQEGAEADHEDEEEEEDGLSFSCKHPRPQPAAYASRPVPSPPPSGAAMSNGSQPRASRQVGGPEAGRVVEEEEPYGWIDRAADTAKNVRDMALWLRGAIAHHFHVI